MSSISLGTGLVSGLDYRSIVDQLIAVDARPRDLLMERMGNITAQKTAYLDISARITALLGRVETLARRSTFEAATATSSLPDVLSPTVTDGAPPGSYQFIVRALASRYQAVSRGYYSQDAPLSSGTLTLESAQARVNRTTGLDELNGHTGVQRGSFKIIAADGNETTINISDVLTVGELIDRINESGGGVTASVTGDGFKLTDTTGGSGTLRVREVSGGTTAASLGFGFGNRDDLDGDGQIDGTDVIYLAETSPLEALNDGLGIRRNVAGGDFNLKLGETTIGVDLSDILKSSTRLERLNHGQGIREGTIRIRSRDGTVAEIDLAGKSTMQEVRNALTNAFGDDRISVVFSGSKLLISDNTTVPEGEEDYSFKIEDVDGHAAQDLGIASEASGSSITGGEILHMDTMADVINAINYATGNEDANKQPLVTAGISSDGYGLTLRSTTSGPLTIEAADNDNVLADLGLQTGTYYDGGGGAVAHGERIVGTLESVLLKTLNGGQGYTGGIIEINANGNTAQVDLTDATTLAEVVARLQDANDTFELGLDIGYDSHGTRLRIANAAASTAPVSISDVSGDFAQQTGLAQTSAIISSDNLQRQYVNESTLLDDLSGGKGVAYGAFKITDANGMTATVRVNQGSDKTVGDVITAINSAGIGVEARINDTGDGIVVVDTTDSDGQLTIEESGSTTAHDLNLLGSSEDGQIDGSLEFQLEIGANDTLVGLAARIDAETTLADAAILNDGTPNAPYRLSLTATVSGSAGDLIIDAGTTDLGISTLTQAQDARVLFGGNPESGILLTSSDNNFENVVDGVSFSVSGIDDDPVSVTVDEDLEGLLETLNKLVSDYNGAMDRIKEAGEYDPETEEAGPLLGEGTLMTIENRLFRTISRSRSETGSFSRLSQVGIETVDGTKLRFDEEKFKTAWASDREGVIRFFTDEDAGIAAVLKEEIEAMTGNDGLIERRTDTLEGTKELLQERVDSMNDALERKRARLMREFQSMEQTLSMLQSQQSALSSLSSMASSASASLLSPQML